MGSKDGQEQTTVCRSGLPPMLRGVSFSNDVIQTSGNWYRKATHTQKKPSREGNQYAKRAQRGKGIGGSEKMQPDCIENWHSSVVPRLVCYTSRTCPLHPPPQVTFLSSGSSSINGHKPAGWHSETVGGDGGGGGAFTSVCTVGMCVHLISSPTCRRIRKVRLFGAKVSESCCNLCVSAVGRPHCFEPILTCVLWTWIRLVDRWTLAGCWQGARFGLEVLQVCWRNCKATKKLNFVLQLRI